MSNPQIELAYNFVENTGVNVFLTGRAGTGKTTFLHNLRKRSHKRIIVVAPTGVAAINAGGMTIHSFFQLPFGFFIPNSIRKDGEIRRFNKTKIKIIRSMELLVIDEISMVRADMLDSIDDVLRRYRDKTRPFGGVQLLMIGDLQQLSPVVKNEEWEVLKKYYATPYFFDSIALKSSQYRNIELKHIYRQTDTKFIDLLAKVRNGDLDNETLRALNSRYIDNFNPDKKEGYVILTSHNNTAKRVNDSKLTELKKNKHTYLATVKGEFPESIYPVEHKLILKKGAQVMFTRNDSPEKKYVNGTIGEIVAISDKDIEVKIKDSSEIINVVVDEWKNIKYALNEETKEITETVQGTFTQYPLKTAWAITIHKSQGLTFDRVIIDAANSFSHGQVYVALSRCRTLEGVVLSTPIRQDSVKKDSNVQEFSDDIERNPPTEQHLLNDKRIYYHAILKELFDFGQLMYNLHNVKRLLKDNLSTVYPKLVDKWDTHLKLFITDIDNVSIQFKTQIDRLMQNQNYDTDSVLAERVTKGAIYFIGKCETIIYPLLSTLNIEIDNREVAKSISGGIVRIVEFYKLKIATLESSKDCFTINDYLKAKANILATEEETKKKKSTSNKQDSNKESKMVIDESEMEDIINGDLFKILRRWRNKKAEEIDKPAFVVAHQKVIIAIASIMPTTVIELGQIKGIGQSFIDKYGTDVLTIVKNYSGAKDLFSEQ